MKSAKGNSQQPDNYLRLSNYLPAIQLIYLKTEKKIERVSDFVFLQLNKLIGDAAGVSFLLFGFLIK